MDPLSDSGNVATFFFLKTRTGIDAKGAKDILTRLASLAHKILALVCQYS